ncbi:MAG: diaminopropionate ammonia-lyase [Bacillota bacterium]|nr:diaminopropionate ammonia-lyase [Bacillota bacterium]
MQIQMTALQNREKGNYDISFLNEEVAKEIYAYHKSFPVYQYTPLVSLNNLAALLKVKDIFIKDESYRFNLNAFKVLGGSYAIGKVVAEKLGMSLEDLPFERLISDEIREKLGEVTFITATDGNHGRGVAWAANQLKQNCIVYMPRGAAQERVENISNLGAEVTVHDANYDECVRMANDLANEKGYYIVQDTAWDGYEDIPRWIMQGYMTMAYEIYQTMQEMEKKPTHVFLQAGVGSMSSAMTGFFANVYPGEEKPVITIVEPDAVACIYESALAGERVLIGGEYFTIMAGLSCGEPNTVGLEVMFDHADYFISASDDLAAHGMRVLGNPVGDDRRVISGESGAAPFGVVSKILTCDKFADLKAELNLNEDSVLLFINTEGDTDREHYLEVVWDGKHPITE